MKMGSDWALKVSRSQPDRGVNQGRLGREATGTV